VKPRVIVNRFEQKMFGPGLKRADLESALKEKFAGTVSNNYRLVREAIDRGIPLDAVEKGSNVAMDLRKVIVSEIEAK
jgi:pilus assembly protein CpaE